MNRKINKFVIIFIILGILFNVGCITINNTTMPPSNEISPTPTTISNSTTVSDANAELGMINTAVGAGMADGQVTTVVGTGISPTSDCEIVAAANSATGANVWVGDYIQGCTK